MVFFTTPQWESTPPSSLSDIALSWLTDKTSLTKRLRDHTNNTIEFCLLFNGWDSNQENWMRRMEWRYQGETWLYCVITIPKDSLIDELQNVGNRPIGEILFAEPSLQRSDFLYQEKENHISRKSVFHFKGKSFELVETFFPAFFSVMTQTPQSKL